MSEQHYKDKPTCPYCDEEIEEWWESIDPNEECHEIECPSCKKTFDLTVRTEINFTSSCHDGKHKYKDNGSEAFPDEVLCKICGDISFKRYL